VIARKGAGLIFLVHLAVVAVLVLGGAISRGAAAPAANKKAPPVAAKPGVPPIAAKPSVSPPGEMDAASKEVVQSLTDAMGGQQTWDRLPYFRFDFVVVKDGKEVARFKHWWDKAHGRCRVEGPDDQGQIVTAIFNLADKKGRAFTDGVIESDTTNIKNIIQNGYERWVNDTYWIMMPFKLHDPGTRVKHARVQQDEGGGETYDVLELSFASGVGLTPHDRYWLYVNQRTHLIDRWEFILTGQKPPPSGSTWESWTSIGPIQLSLARRFAGKPAMLRFENVAVPATMDETVFTYSRLKS
jgi:hypothetical protein